MANVIEIESFDAPDLDIYARLTENQLLNRADPENALFIAESPLVIGRALDAGYEPVSILTEPRHIEGAGRDIIERCGNIPVFTAPIEVLTCLTGFKLTRGMLCAMRRKPYRELSDVLRTARRIAVLENIMNPTNLGAVFRSAAALGMDAVLVTGEGSDPLYRRSIRVSMGTVFQVPWTVIDWPNGIYKLKEMGFSTAAMALSDSSISLSDERLHRARRLAVILGTEGDGLKKSTVAQCDYTVKIPMSNGVDSLNVAAASAVAFYELGRTDCRK